MIAVLLFFPGGLAGAGDGVARLWRRCAVMSETAATLLDVRGLACRFGGLQAIADLDFSVREGEIKAIIGPNGAGKTTLFNMISGVIAPSAGQIRLSRRTHRPSAALPPRPARAQPHVSESCRFSRT